MISNLTAESAQVNEWSELEFMNRKTFKRCLSLIFSLFLIVGCKSILKRDFEEVTLDPAVKNYLDSQVSQAENQLDQQNYVGASAAFAKYESEFPQSVYLNRSKLGHARALQGEKKFTEAIQLYREIIDSSLDQNPEFEALACFYSSYSYEALGDEPRTLTALTTAKSFSQYLPREIAFAELPARLAAYYKRNGDETSARKYFVQAERGMATLLSDDNEKNRKIKAKTYFKMGELSPSQIKPENLQARMNSLGFMQIFLLRSLELADSEWSPRALENLQLNYQEIWNAMQQIPKDKELDPTAAERLQQEAQIKSLYQILDLIQRLKVYRHPENIQEGVATRELFLFLAKIEAQAQQMLASSEIQPLTPEAQKRQSLHREGVIRDGKKADENPIKTGTDPNLQGK